MGDTSQLRVGHGELATELIDQIVDNFRDDKTSLKHCSLIGPTWTSSCHRILFHTLSLGPVNLVVPDVDEAPPPSKSNQRKFDDDITALPALIRLRPQFLPHVRELRFLEPSKFRSRVIADPRTLRIFISRFPGLSSIDIELGRGLALQDMTLDEDLTAILPSANKISLDRLVLRVPPSLSRTFPHIFNCLESVQDLCLYQDGRPVPKQPLPSTCKYDIRLPLSSITLSRNHTKLMKELCNAAIDPHSLRSLHLDCIDAKELEQVNKFLLRWAHRLEEIEFGFRTSNYYKSQGLWDIIEEVEHELRTSTYQLSGSTKMLDQIKLDDISSCTCLWRVHCRMIMDSNLDAIGTQENLWSRVLEILLHVTPNLRSLRLDWKPIYNSWQVQWWVHEAAAERLDWELLQRVLDRFESLESFEIHLSEHDERSQLQSFIQKKLSSRANALLQFV